MSVDVRLVNDDLQAQNYHVTGADLVVQRVKTRVRTFLGEWILDQSKGLPYLTWVAEKPPDEVTIGNVVLADLLDTPGVKRVDRYTSTKVLQGGRYTVRITGDIVLNDEDADGLPIVVTVGARGNATPVIVAIGGPNAIVG